MSEIKITAELRTEFGKGAARRLRRADKVPAVLYGHGTDPIHISLPGHEAMLGLRTANALFAIEFDGRTELALPKHVQRDPIKGFIEHVDLLLVKRGEKVTVEIPVVLTGNAESGTLVTTENTSVSIEAEATHIPETIELSIEGLPAGTLLHASDLKLPNGATLKSDPDLVLVNVATMPTAEEVAEEIGEAAPEAEAAEAVEAAIAGEAGEAGEQSEES